MDALAWQREQDLTCDGCGQPRDESFNPEAEGAYEPTAWRCHACRAVSNEQRRFAESGSTDGLYVGVRRNGG